MSNSDDVARSITFSIIDLSWALSSEISHGQTWEANRFLFDHQSEISRNNTSRRQTPARS